LEHYDSRHFISPPTLGRNIVLNDSKIEKKREEEGRRRRRRRRK